MNAYSFQLTIEHGSQEATGVVHPVKTTIDTVVHGTDAQLSSMLEARAALFAMGLKAHPELGSVRVNLAFLKRDGKPLSVPDGSSLLYSSDPFRISGYDSEC